MVTLYSYLNSIACVYCIFKSDLHTFKNVLCDSVTRSFGTEKSVLQHVFLLTLDLEISLIFYSKTMLLIDITIKLPDEGIIGLHVFSNCFFILIFCHGLIILIYSLANIVTFQVFKFKWQVLVIKFFLNFLIQLQFMSLFHFQ